MNSIFSIGIPTVNRWDLLRPSLEKYLVNFPNTRIIIWDNGKQGIDITHPNLTVIHSPQPQSVADSWNRIIDLMIATNENLSHFYILNDDVTVSHNESQVMDFISRYHSQDLYIGYKGFCSFILPVSTWNIIGHFDTNFKGAYFEDKDYERRMKLAFMHTMRNAFLDPSIYNESSSIALNPSLNRHYQDNWKYYVDKWGGNVGGEIFSTPFNK